MTGELEPLDFPETQYLAAVNPGQYNEAPAPQGYPENLVAAINRLAAAIERAVPQPGAPQRPQLAPLPPVVAQPVSTVCPVHNQPWKTVPAGITKHGPNAGQPYEAFVACPVRGCTQRPPR